LKLNFEEREHKYQNFLLTMKMNFKYFIRLEKKVYYENILNISLDYKRNSLKKILKLFIRTKSKDRSEVFIKLLKGVYLKWILLVDLAFHCFLAQL